MAIRRLLVFFLLISACFAQHTPRKCADVPIPTTDGKTVRISQYHGKVVVMLMFLSDCPECLQELQSMAQWQAEMGPRGLQILAVSLDPDGSVVKPFADRYRFPFPIGHLDKDPAIKLLDLSPLAHPRVPYVTFIDWMGNVRFQYAGNDPIFNSGDSGLRGVTIGLLKQAAEKKGPEYKTAPKQ